MDRVAFSIFGIDVMWYGTLIGIGFILAIMISYYRASKFNIDPDFILTLTIWIIPCALIGARAYYVLFNWERYAGDFSAIINVRAGGLAVHGGLILCFIVGYMLCKYYKEKFLDVADLVAPVIALAQSIGRWGNFFNEEAHGYATDLPWAQIINGVGYHPTFLYESIWCFALFLFLIFYMEKRRAFSGQLALLYGMLYSLERIFVEQLRTDSLMLGPFKQAQVLSFTVIVVCAVLYAYLQRKARKR